MDASDPRQRPGQRSYKSKRQRDRNRQDAATYTSSEGEDGRTHACRDCDLACDVDGDCGGGMHAGRYSPIMQCNGLEYPAGGTTRGLGIYTNASSLRTNYPGPGAELIQAI